MVKKKVILLPRIEPNISLIRQYQKALKPLIDAMAHSVEYWVKTPFEAGSSIMQPPTVSLRTQGIKDASPTARIQKTLNKIKRRYQTEFNEVADKVANNIVSATQKDVSARLRGRLKDVMSVDVRITRRVNTAMLASRAESISYIRRIPQKYFADVEFEIMQTLQQGRDMVALTEKLQKRYKMTLNNAYFLAQDQVKKATEAIERTSKQDLGLYIEIWRHSSISAVPRHSHLEADGKEYDNRKGCYIDGEYIFPKQKPGCNCYCQTKVEL